MCHGYVQFDFFLFSSSVKHRKHGEEIPSGLVVDMCDEVDALRLVLVHLPPAKLRLSRTVARHWDAAADASCLWQAHQRWVRIAEMRPWSERKMEGSETNAPSHVELARDMGKDSKKSALWWLME